VEGKIRLAAVAALFTLALCLPSPALAQGEEGTTAASDGPVRVSLEVPAPTVYQDEEISGSDLPPRQRCRDACSRMVLNLRTKLDATFVTFSDGSRSYWVSGIDVVLGYRFLDVFIHPRYRRGSCEYGAALAHEEEHLRADRAVVEEYADRMRAVLLVADWPAYANPLKPNSLAEGRAHTRAQMDALIQPLRDELQERRRQASESVDSTEHAQQILKACSRR